MKSILFALLIFSSSAFSGELINVGTVISVENTSQNTSQFVVWVTGSGACNNAPIRFKESNSQSKESFERAFAMLLSAQATGFNVKIFGIDDNNCESANWVRVTKN
ncbi:hypothetical protein EYS14_23155 [Alteromonadaceae bacterium M269]|nr:hypothetical protein EYS14_23155 [Alteromonadaceae bacterium M269]